MKQVLNFINVLVSVVIIVMLFSALAAFLRMGELFEPYQVVVVTIAVVERMVRSGLNIRRKIKD